MAELNFDTASVEVRADGADAAVVTLKGEVDMAVAGAIGDAVAAALDTLGPSLSDGLRRVVFEMSELRFMDSSGIALMLGVSERAGIVELRNASPIVRRVVEASGLSEILRLAT